MKRFFLWAILGLLLPAGLFAQNSFRNAMRLDGDGDLMAVANHSTLNFGGDFTISAWFNTDTLRQGRLVYKVGLNPRAGYAIFVDQGTVRGFMMSPTLPVGLTEVFSPTGFPQREDYYDDGAWHHVALVRKGSAFSLYVDGRLEMASENTTDASLFNEGTLWVGAQIKSAAGDTDFYFDGLIDELRLWKVARSEAQIRAVMDDTLGAAYYTTPDSGLVAYYRFDDVEDLGIGDPGVNDMRDFSVHGNHGKLVGDATVEAVVTEDFVQPRLTLQFWGMSVHMGEHFRVRVVDKDSDDEVGRQKIAEINNPDFEVWLNALRKGHSYWVDFYADHNKNNTYDAPPIDYAWRLELNEAQGNDTLVFVHNTNFTDIGWGPLIEFSKYTAKWSGRIKTAKGNHADFTVNINIDVENETCDGSFETTSFFGLVDWLELYFSGSFSAVEDTVQIALEQDSVKTSMGKHLGSAYLQQSGFEGNLNWVNEGPFYGDFALDILGVPMTFNVEGTLGRTQAIFTFETDFMNASGIVLAEEDTVLVLSMTGVEGPNVGLVPQRLTLDQNYPNPFYPLTTIPFSLPQRAQVSIKLYDLQGRELATLLDRELLSGEHTVSFYSGALASNIYFYHMTVTLPSGKKMVESKQFVILK